jgi:hypothetical protein
MRGVNADHVTGGTRWIRDDTRHDLRIEGALLFTPVRMVATHYQFTIGSPIATSL